MADKPGKRRAAELETENKAMKKALSQIYSITRTVQINAKGSSRMAMAKIYGISGVFDDR